MAWDSSYFMRFTASPNEAKDAFMELIEGNTFGDELLNEMAVSNAVFGGNMRDARVFMTRDGRDYVLEMHDTTPAGERKGREYIGTYSVLISATNREVVRSETKRAEGIIEKYRIARVA